MRRSRKPVWAFPSIGGSNPPLSVEIPGTCRCAGSFPFSPTLGERLGCTAQRRSRPLREEFDFPTVFLTLGVRDEGAASSLMRFRKIGVEEDGSFLFRSGERWPYLSSVTVIDEWPMKVWKRLRVHPGRDHQTGERMPALVQGDRAQADRLPGLVRTQAEAGGGEGSAVVTAEARAEMVSMQPPINRPVTSGSSPGPRSCQRPPGSSSV